MSSPNQPQIGSAPNANDSNDRSAKPAVPIFSHPRLECIIIELSDGSFLDDIVKEHFEGWNAQSIPNRKQSFDLLPPESGIEIDAAWSLVHQLRADKRIVNAEPSWVVQMLVEEEKSEEENEGFLGFMTGPDRAAREKSWAPDLIKVREAWKVPSTNGKSQGEGIRIAHPDSGYTKHPEIFGKNQSMDLKAGHDFVDNDRNPLDKDGFHGTGTASVLFSSSKGDIIGVAPKGTLVPMRVSQKGWVRPSPVIAGAGTRHLRNAIYRAIEKDCHVISISLGWLGNRELHAAVRAAWEKDIIIVAAAGNYTGPVIVWPARYSECICMGGCDALRGPWEGSARGGRIDFSGPAQDVWKAGFDRKGAEIPKQSKGTSFATAMTAGIAALWLAHHGRDNLINKYHDRGVRLAEVFRKVLIRSSDARPRSFFGGLGPIVNAKQALKTRLPEPDEVTTVNTESAAFTLNSPTAQNQASLDQAFEILGMDYGEGRQYFKNALQTDEKTLSSLPANCGDELAFHALLKINNHTQDDANEWMTTNSTRINVSFDY